LSDCNFLSTFLNRIFTGNMTNDHIHQVACMLTTQRSEIQKVLLLFCLLLLFHSKPAPLRSPQQHNMVRSTHVSDDRIIVRCGMNTNTHNALICNRDS
jgi:hypothetical protein